MLMAKRLIRTLLSSRIALNCGGMSVLCTCPNVSPNLGSLARTRLFACNRRKAVLLLRVYTQLVYESDTQTFTREAA